ncbi:MAG TPA: acyl carrier protein [Burkholderiales bacterium]|jgi:acyl carrier protein|nr:acyl carrier protein [Burkholderiales bacterium]
MQAFVEEMAEILGVAPADLVPDFKLADGAWDSLAIVSTIASVDEHFNVIVEARALGDCETFANILALAKQGA